MTKETKKTSHLSLWSALYTIVEQTILGSCFNFFFHISFNGRRAEETPRLLLVGAYLCLHALYGLAFMLLLYFFSFVKKYGMCLPSFIRRTNHKMLLMKVKKMATVLRSWPIFFLFKYIKIYHGWLCAILWHSQISHKYILLSFLSSVATLNN